MKRKKLIKKYPYIFFMAFMIILALYLSFQYRNTRNVTLYKLNTDIEYNSIVVAGDIAKILEKSEMILDLLEQEMQNIPDDQSFDLLKLIKEYRLKYFDIYNIYFFDADGMKHNPHPENSALERDLRDLFNFHKQNRIRTYFSVEKSNRSHFMISRAVFNIEGSLSKVFICSISLEDILSFDEIQTMYNVSEIAVLDDKMKILLYKDNITDPNSEGTKISEIIDRENYSRSFSGVQHITDNHVKIAIFKIQGYPYTLALATEYQEVLSPIRRQYLVYSVLYLILFGLGIYLIRYNNRQKARQRLLEEKINQQSKLEAIGRVTGGVAHEFNNINFAIMSASELLKDSDNPESENHYLEVIMSSIDRATKIIQDLLSYSRNNFMILKRELDIAHLINKAVEAVKQNTVKPVEISIRMQEKIKLKADQQMLGDALLQLVENAVQAVNENGRVTIECHRYPGFKISYPEESVDPLLNYVEVSVTDNGNGIAPENIDKIFDPFFSTKAQGKGMGLGLSSVYGIVKEHEGFIKVESEQNRGTVIRIAFPILKD